MSDRDVTDEELIALAQEIENDSADEFGSYDLARVVSKLRRFAREMQARGLELAAENPNLPEVERIWTLREAERIREGRD